MADISLLVATSLFAVRQEVGVIAECCSLQPVVAALMGNTAVHPQNNCKLSNRGAPDNQARKMLVAPDLTRPFPSFLFRILEE